ncbi:protein translocase subunit SecF [Sporomusa acidovorans]|uniref:Protein-export membrane protein SecF n=1 Tax=Sporomusa acidovorans (strain ATCC 49682 / DSM 3132 / Mol) TaxID=1123286 RepID=A0ABZ3J3F2_SPOA4|nr:protein translocase subunit SecF [Sporomusa acidovorans]OZC20884.1 protein-export membrane protein SecF [Sporomusa acidovorans DSM 3132]SDE60059.1 preprotein translocase subunit SecF [Sporomusa acidovorans]
MKFDIVGKRYWWFLLSALVLIPGIISMATQGFNLGIDFTGGTLIDLKFAQPVAVGEIRDVLKDYQLEGSTIQLALTAQGDRSNNVFIRTHVLNEDERRDVLKGFETKLGSFDVLRVEKVGAVIGAELTRQAIWALLVSWVLMIAYITYRFEYRFAIAGIAALVHDIFVVLGIFSILQKEIDATFVAALLTIVGYSINDTIVIFDRIRENLKTYKKSEGLAELVNRSIWQTMTRSIYTVLTVAFATVALYVFGGETTKNFSLALLIGFASGAYSSIFNASQIWVTWREHDEKRRTEQRIKGAK